LISNVLTLALKDLRLLLRDRFGLFWVILFPLLMALFFGSIFSGGGSRAGAMKLALVGDNSAATQAFFKQLSQSEVLQTTPMPLDSARALVAHGELTAYVRYLSADDVGGSFMSLGRDSIEVGIDPSRRAESEYLRGLISQAYFTQLQAKFTDPKQWRPEVKRERSLVDSVSWLSGDQKSLLQGVLGSLDTFLTTVDTIDTAAARNNSPFGNINLRMTGVTSDTKHPHSSWEITFPQSLLWALIGCAATFALSIVVERRTGTYLRLRLAPITRIQILLGKGLACFIACSVVCGLLLAFGAVVFGVRIGSVALLAAAVLSAAFCFVGLMMLISVLGKSERTVAGASWAIMLVLSMIGGGMIPLMFMPEWIARLSNFSPMKWCVLSFEGAIWRGFGAADMLMPVGILISIGLCGFGIGTLVLSRADK
jgi:ABC-2 type transport system permease protein